MDATNGQQNASTAPLWPGRGMKRRQDRPVGVSQCVESVFTAVETGRYHRNLDTTCLVTSLP